MLIKGFFTSVEVKKLKLFSKEGSVYEISYSFSQKKVRHRIAAVRIKQYSNLKVMFSRGFTQRKRELILYLESLTWQTATAGKMHLVAKRNYIRPVKHSSREDLYSPLYTYKNGEIMYCVPRQAVWKWRKITSLNLRILPQVLRCWTSNWTHRFIVPRLIVGVLMKCLSSSMIGYPKLI